MKRIFTILSMVLFATSLYTFEASAQNNNLLLGIRRDSVRVRKNPNSPFLINRIDREIDKNIFAYQDMKLTTLHLKFSPMIQWKLPVSQ